MKDNSTEEILIILGQRFAMYRTNERINKNKILEQVGISRATLHRFEQGKGISLISFIKLSRSINKIGFFKSLTVKNPLKQTRNFKAQKDEEILSDIGFYIYVERFSAQIKLEDLAVNAGISTPTLNRLEKGHEGVSLETYIKCLKAIGKADKLLEF